MTNKNKQISQVFSSAAKSALLTNQEINDGGLVWRKLSDSSGSWRYDFSIRGKRCKGVIGRESNGVTLSSARNNLKRIEAELYLERGDIRSNAGGYSNVNFEVVANSYLDWAEINRSGFRQTKGRMKNQLIPYFENYTVGEIDSRDCK